MRTRAWLSFALLLCLLAFPSAVAQAAETDGGAYASATDCYTCHQGAGPAVSKVDFAAPGAVDYARCTSCHLGMPGIGHYHFGHPATSTQFGVTTCLDCHDDEAAFAFVLPAGATAVAGYRAPTAYGYFAKSTSLQTAPAVLHQIHARTGWVEGTFGGSCSRCHASAACSACHTPSVPHGDHAVSQYPAVTLKQATGAAVVYASSTCVNDACHSIAAAGTAGFTPTCTSCHAAQQNVHGYESVDHVADDATVDGMPCSTCHQLDLATAHGDADAAGPSCATCHPSPRDSLGAWDQSCATGGCHTASSSAPMHADAQSAHAVDSGNTLCLGCHDGTDLGSVHAGAADAETGRTSCFVCHTGVSGEPVTGDCTACHFTFDAHYDQTAHTSSWAPLVACAGAGCHSVSGDLMAVHAENDPSFTCAGCHDSFRVAAQIDAGLTGCGDCHAGVTQTSGHRAAHWAEPPLTSYDSASGTYTHNYSYYTGSTGPAPTGDCTMCHTSNLIDEHNGVWEPAIGYWSRAPRTDSTGAALTCDSCHASADVAVADAIAGGFSACESCHDVHGPVYSAVHRSTFVDGAAVDCAPCHDADIAAEHNGTYSTTTPSGRVLTGCAVCHDNVEGERGATVQSAIEVTNDVRCSACHAGEHPDFGSHTAAAPASAACATCHVEGGSDSIDVKRVHADAAPGACAVCHSAPAGRIDWTSATAECASCHAAEGTTYHRGLPAAHTSSSMDVSCLGAGCHVARTLPEEHERFLAGSGYASTCGLCHDNADPTRIDWTTATAECSSCHEVHGDIAAIHAAGASQACVDCHEAGDVRLVHGDTPDASCAVCHAAPAGRIDWTSATAECVSCHAALAPVDPNHYPTAAHFASAEGSCNQCHLKDMKAEHSKPTVGVTCVVCHETAVDGFTAPWDKTCGSCHPTKHGQRQTKHRSATTACSGTGCHIITDVAAIHSSCGRCHSSTAPATTTDCLACHAGGHDLREPMSTCSTSGCHSPSELHGEPAHGQSLCTTCHGATAPGCDGSNCHSLPEIHGESDHQNVGCAYCHTSGIAKPHVTVTSKLRTDSSWRSLCGSCHGRTHMSGCAACHAPGEREDIHDASAHMRNDRCGACHTIATTDATLNCALCHPNGSKPTSGGGADEPTGSGEIIGRVTDGAGAPVGGASISIGGSSVLSDADGWYVLMNVASGTGQVTVSKSGYATQTIAVTVVADDAITLDVVLTPALSNLAYLKSATASSTDSTNYASRAVDGITSTYWRSRGGGAQWLRVDLGVTSTFGTVVIDWDGSRYARAYRIETSADGVTWTTRSSTTTGAGGVETIAFAPVSARYVRAYLTLVNDYHYRIEEFQVWGY